MILTEKQIKHRIQKGEIVINPYNPKYVQPNSIDVHLGKTLLIPKVDGVWDIKKEIEYEEIEIPEEGFVLEPNVLYLGCTYEYTETHTAVPILEGKSSLARVGISVHQTAGVGELGFCGTWTVEITTIYPVRLYAGMPIGAILYHEPCGTFDSKYGDAQYESNYQGQTKPTPSRIWNNFTSKCIDYEKL